jgi:hypothetical protein
VAPINLVAAILLTIGEIILLFLLLSNVQIFIIVLLVYVLWIAEYPVGLKTNSRY